MKFPFIKSIGPTEGWYRVGPLARMNACDFIDTPEAEAARVEFREITEGRPNGITLAYHWARMIEILHAIETIGQLLALVVLDHDRLIGIDHLRIGGQDAMGILRPGRAQSTSTTSTSMESP